jgi:hypothetical protein
MCPVTIAMTFSELGSCLVEIGWICSASSVTNARILQPTMSLVPAVQAAVSPTCAVARRVRSAK